MTPSRATRASPQTAPAAVTTISNSAVCPCSAASPEGSSASSPQAYPIRQNTKAFWPTKWLPGGATSSARPPQNPVSMPISGPPARASAATASSTRLGPAPPGNAIRSTTVSWTMTVTATTTKEISPRTSAPARGRGGGGGGRIGRGVGRRQGAGRAGGNGDGDRRRGARQDRDPRVVPRHLYHHADDAESGEVDVGSHHRGLGERPRVAAHRDDRADGHAGHLGLVAHRGVGDDLLPGPQHRVRVEQTQPQQGGSGKGLTRSGHVTDLAAARH